MSKSEKIRIPLKDLGFQSEEEALAYLKKLWMFVKGTYLLTNGMGEAWLVSDTTDIPLTKTQFEKIVDSMLDNKLGEFKKSFDTTTADILKKILEMGSKISQLNQPAMSGELKENIEKIMKESSTETKPEKNDAEVKESITTSSETVESPTQTSEIKTEEKLLDGKVHVASAYEVQERAGEATESKIAKFKCEKCGVVEVPVPKDASVLTLINCPKCGGIIFNRKGMKPPEESKSSSKFSFLNRKKK